ncbi:MAG: alpha/beta hydrolase [Rhizobiales bacterium PAR1]|nr:MAG: alpha/beta hydrolase [Rhizobiales bacterium PAR1]
MTHAALKVIRPVVRLSSLISPRTTGRLAFHLFCTPIGHAKVNDTTPQGRAARALFARATARQVTHGCGYVQTFRFEPEGVSRGTVLVLHGWTGQSLFMAGFIEPLLAQGFRVIAMDMPGHGASSGRRLNFALGIEAISAVVRDEQPLAGIVAHSFGGAVALAAVAGGVEGFPPITARRVVTVASPRAMQGYGRQFSQQLGLTQRGHHAFEAEVLAVAGRPMESFCGAEYLRRTLVPTLVMHAPDDKEIPFSDAEALAEAGSHVELRAMPGLGHRRILMSRAVQQAAAEFIAKN